MLTFEFTADDLAHTRFAISPLWELVAGLRLLREPARSGPHLPWVREVLPLARESDLALLLAMVPREGYFPDFLTPPPTSPVASIADELALMRATPPGTVRENLERVRRGGARSRRLQRAIEDPAAALENVADVLERWWELALASHWPRVRAMLDADLAYRARRLTDGGPAVLFSDLDRETAWRGDRLEVGMKFEGRQALAGRGLVIVASAFGWHRSFAMADDEWQPTLFYPARGIGLLWEPGDHAPGALAAVLGRARADLLAHLDAPRSTTDLARQLEMTPGGASQHLKALREAGLVSATRQGREVLYLRTALAEDLQAGAGAGTPAGSR